MKEKRAKGLNSLTSMFRVIQDQHIIQINGNMKTLVTARNGIGLVSEVKTLGVKANPNGKTFHWQGLCCQTMLNVMVLFNNRVVHISILVINRKSIIVP